LLFCPKKNQLLNQKKSSFIDDDNDNDMMNSTTTTDVAVVSSISDLKRSTIDDDENEKMDSSTTDVPVVGFSKIIDYSNRKQSSCIEDDDEVEKINSSTTDVASDFSTAVLFRDLGILLRTDSVQQSLTTTTSSKNVVSLNYTTVLDQFSLHFCNNIVQNFEKDTNNLLMGVNLVLSSIDDKKLFEDVYRDIENRTAQHFKYLEGKIPCNDKKN